MPYTQISNGDFKIYALSTIKKVIHGAGKDHTDECEWIPSSNSWINILSTVQVKTKILSRLENFHTNCSLGVTHITK